MTFDCFIKSLHVSDVVDLAEKVDDYFSASLPARRGEGGLAEYSRQDSGGVHEEEAE